MSSNNQELQFLTCKECKYEYSCPVRWSYLNAACITIQKPKNKENIELPFDKQSNSCYNNYRIIERGR